jgi:probable DNA repair protein
MERLFHLIRSDIPVITVNARLSRYIRQRYDHEMRASGLNTWKSPLIIPLPAWIESLWHESWPDKPLLSPTRSQTLWEKVISDDRYISGKDTLSISGVADTSYYAYSLMKEYRLPFPREDIYLTEEAMALKRWIRSYVEEIKGLGFISPLSLPDIVIRFIEDRTIKIPAEIILAGFDEITPRTTSIIKAIEGTNSKVDFWPYEPIGPENPIELPDIRDRLTIRQYTDMVEEVIQAARWARRTIRPGTRIGFIVPELDRYREVIRREFSAELNPPSILPWKDTANPFNISLGNSLYEEPLIKLALDILSIDERRHEIHKVSSILLSPFISSGETECLAISRLDAEFKENNALNIGLFDIQGRIRTLKTTDPFHLQSLVKKLENWIGRLKEEKGKKYPSHWAGKFSDLLEEMGWVSGGITLKSAEYQVLKAWKELLGQLAGLDDILGRISRRDAVFRLTKIAKEKIHQPESPECPIQVLGTLEASGQYFDHIWILGAHEDVFPAQPSPNPFIPLYIQKEHNIPHSSPERELSFARVSLRRLLNSAPRFEVSFPETIEKRETRLSALFSQLSGKEDSSLVREGSRMKDTVHSEYGLEEMPPEEDIPIADEEMKTISGGSSIIRNQSACPFKAFATHRLGARGIAIPEPGFSAAERGTITHKALKFFWERVRDSRGLREIMGRPEIDHHIEYSAGQALKGVHLLQNLSKRYVDLERERIENLLREWIDVELKRVDFTVRELESKREITIGDLNISARFDRIDRLDDGREVILDYKTGECNRDDWLFDRPKDPQLLLYNLSGNYDAIAFASVKAGDCRFKGISRDEDILPGIKSFNEDRWKMKIDNLKGWSDLMDRWRETVVNIAKEFINGVAKVDPKRYGRNDSACRHCDMMVLCRIFEAENKNSNEQ